MEPKFNSSFIPKQMLQEDVTGGPSSSNKYVKHRTVMGPGYFISIIVFAIAIAVSGGLFGYTKIIDKRITEKLENLEATKESYDVQVIHDLARVDTRLNEASRLVNNHIAATELFDLLEEITLTRVRYSRLTYENPGMGSDVLMAVAGEADSFENVALQMEVFRNHEALNNPAVLRLSKVINPEDAREMTTFELESLVDPRLVTYSAALAENRRGQAAQVLQVQSGDTVQPDDTAQAVNSDLTE